MNGIVNAHKAEFDAEPEVVVEVPQVTTFLGAFADFCKGYSLMSTNTQGLRVAVSRRPDQMVIAFNSTSKERKKFQLTGIRAKREDRWASVIKGLCQLLVASGFRLPSGFNLTIKGQSAVADPPALSAALASGLVVAFNELFSFGIEPNNLVRYAYSVNKYTDKYKSRLRDLITIFTAEQGKMMLFDLETCAHKTFDYPFRKGGKTGSWFIDCSLPADELSSEVSLFRENAEAAFSMLRSMLPEKEKVRELTHKDIVQNYPRIPEDYKRIIRFILEDSTAALKCYDYLLSGDAVSIGKILTYEQRNISTLAELTSPEVDWLVKRGSETDGVNGVTEISVGITGTLVALVDEANLEEYKTQLKEYERIFGFKPVVREYIPSGAIKVIDKDEYPSV